jgi:uncharacterized membrane protein
MSVAAAQLQPIKDARTGSQSDERKARLVMGALAFSYVLIRLWNLQTFCLDTDEIFSVIAARESLRGLLASVSSDVVHPPLSYLLLKAWITLGGKSLLWLRLLPCLLSLAALLPIRVLFRQYKLNPQTRILALAFLTVNDYQVFHARYLRMYALLYLLTLISLVLFNAWLERLTRRRWLILTAINLLLVYTHYFGWLVVVSQLLFVTFAVRRQLITFLKSVTLIGILFAPWAAVVTNAAMAKGGLGSNLGWIRHPKLKDLFWYFAGCHGTLEPIRFASLMLVLAFVLLAVSLWRRLVGNHNDAVTNQRRRFAVVLAALPPLVSFLVSNILPESVWGNRHLIISAFPYTLLLSIEVTTLRNGWLRRRVLFVFSVWIAWSGYRETVRPEPRLNVEVLVQQVARLAAQSGKSPVRNIYCLDPYIAFPMRFYFAADTREPWSLVTVSDPTQIRDRATWVAYNRKTWHGAESPQDTFRRQGYEIGLGVWSGDRWDGIVVFEVNHKPKEQRK